MMMARFRRWESLICWIVAAGLLAGHRRSWFSSNNRCRHGGSGGDEQSSGNQRQVLRRSRSSFVNTTSIENWGCKQNEADRGLIDGAGTSDGVKARC